MALLQKSTEKAAKIITGHRYARVISHYDADGITAAGILCNALLRHGIQFHATIVTKLDRSFVRELDEELVIICDMGTAQSDLLAEYLAGREVVIIDHHAPLTAVPAFHSPSAVLINPCCLDAAEAKTLRNERGSTICAAGLAYLVARRMAKDRRGNVDLAGLAIAGTLGDKLELTTGINRLILDEALKEGIVSVKKGLKLSAGKLRDSLLFSTEPYLPFAGKLEWINAFLKELGIDGKTDTADLTEEEEKRLAGALLPLLRESPAEHSDELLLGPTYLLHAEVIRHGEDFMRIVDACGRMGKAGIGVGLCLREERLVEEATSLYRSIQTKLVSELNRLESEEHAISELEHLFYFYVQESGVTGILAGIVADYLRTTKPVIVLNKKDRLEEGKSAETKISARCHKRALAVTAGGLDLARAMEQAAKEVGGYGGGHPVAAGASIPDGSEERFTAALDRILGAQKGQKSPPRKLD
jgi:single-stranded-DNA-specific exonuclease